MTATTPIAEPMTEEARARRELILTVGGIFVVAFLARLIFASQVVFPNPEDTAYYVGVSQNLLHGRGLVSDAIWSFGTPPLDFPRPAFEVWLPLPSYLALIPMFLFGATFASAQLSSIILGAIVPVLAWRLAADVAIEREMTPARSRTLAIGSGLTAAVYLPLLLHSALPDSTMPFAVLALGSCLLMTRIVADPRGGNPLDGRVVGLGLLIGLAALTRNEAIYIGFAWAIVAWWIADLDQRTRVWLIATPAIIAGLVFLPWAIRDFFAFGSPFPGQAIANALSIKPSDIFAWNDPPNLFRYLGEGPIGLIAMRIGGIIHNLFNVLILPGLPISIIGIIGLLWTIRGNAIRPVVIVSFTAFVVTSLVFPVATTWGTFLHAAGIFQVLLVVSALLLLDGVIEEAGIRRQWTRPNAWLGTVFGVFGSLLFSIVLLTAFSGSSRDSALLYEVLPIRMATVGHPVDRAGGPVITDHPIWLAGIDGVEALALPDEPLRDVLDLADTFGAKLLVLTETDGTYLPADIDAGLDGAGCFQEIDLGHPETTQADPLADVRVFQIGCP
jgi:uncharacterized protein YhhL (DUF1145 family)